jgi:hypothetical protein
VSPAGRPFGILFRYPPAFGPGYGTPRGDLVVIMKATDDLGHADPLEPLEELFRDLRASAAGLSGREAARRLEVSEYALESALVNFLRRVDLITM